MSYTVNEIVIPADIANARAFVINLKTVIRHNSVEWNERLDKS